MRVALVNYGHPASVAGAEELLPAVRSLTGWAEALARAGAEVSVFQGFREDASFRRRGVDWHLVAGPYAPYLWPWRLPAGMHRRIAAARPEVVHVNSLLYALQVRDLRRRLGGAPVLVVQHHGEGPRPSRLGRILQRRLLAAADGFFFNGPDTAEPWRAAGVLGRRSVVAVAEGSSELEPLGRDEARRRSGVRGEPAILWLGNLDRNKDPLTVLDGLEPVLARRPAARLYLAYRRAALLAEVGRRVASSEVLRRAVTLLGRVPYAELAPLASSADLLVQGSHREGSGYAVLDALACGVVPVVTDIPPFRFLTGGGRAGVLWPPGDAAALTAAVEALLAEPLAPRRRAAREHFDAHLSYDALARQALAAYAELGAARRRPLAGEGGMG
ncbi:MAG: glycosyltransferase [Acidobacteria bacterium]|nr:MAG: glycosyltransferase [Acidobacteriota bacterium]